MTTKDSFSESLRQRLQDAPQVDITQEESIPNVMTLQSVATGSQSYDSESSSNKNDEETDNTQSSQESDEQILKESAVEENEQQNNISNQLNQNAQKLVSDIVQDILGVLIGIRDDLVDQQYDSDQYSYSDEYSRDEYSDQEYYSEYESAEADQQIEEAEPDDLSQTEDSFREGDGILLSHWPAGGQGKERDKNISQKKSKHTTSRPSRAGTSFEKLLQNKIKLEQLRQYSELSSLTQPQQLQQNVAQLLQQNQQAQLILAGLAPNATLTSLTQLINTAIESQLDKRLKSKKKQNQEQKQKNVDESVFDRLSKPKTNYQQQAVKSKLPKPQKQTTGRPISPYNLIKMSNSSTKSKISTAGTLQLSSPGQKETQLQQHDKNTQKQQNVQTIADISYISRIDNKSMSEELSNAEVVYISNLIEDMNASQRLKENTRNIQLSAQRLSRAEMEDEDDGEEIEEANQHTAVHSKQQQVENQSQSKRSYSNNLQQKQSSKRQAQMENTFNRAVLSTRENNEPINEILDQHEYNQPKQSYRQSKQTGSRASVPHSSPSADVGSQQRNSMNNSSSLKQWSTSNTQKSLTSSKQATNKPKLVKPSTKIQHTIARPSSVVRVPSSTSNQNKPEVHSPKRQEKPEKQRQPQTLTKSELDRAKLRREVQISHSNLRNKVATLENEKTILEKDLAAYRAANISNTKHMSEEYRALKARFQATTKELDALKLQYQQSLNDARHKNIELNKKLIKEANFLMDQLSKHTGNSVNPSPIRPLSYGSINNDAHDIRKHSRSGEVRDIFAVVKEPEDGLYKQKHIIESTSPSPVRAIPGVKTSGNYDKLESNIKQEESKLPHQKHKIILPPDTDRLQYSRTHQDKEKEVEISDIDYSAQQRIEIEHQRLQPIVHGPEGKYDDLQNKVNSLHSDKKQTIQEPPLNVGYDTVRHIPTDVQKNLSLTPVRNPTASIIGQQSPMTALSTISQPDHNIQKSSMIDDVPVQVANLKRIIQSHLSAILKSEKNAKDVQMHISQQVQDSLMKFKKMEEKTEERIDSLKLNEDEAVILRAQTKSKITAAIDDLCRNIVQQIQMRASINQIRASQSNGADKPAQISNAQVENLAKELSDSIGDIFQLKKSLVMPDVQHLRGLTALSTNPTTTQQPTFENTPKKDFVEDTSNNIQLRNNTDSEQYLSNQDKNFRNTRLSEQQLEWNEQKLQQSAGAPGLSIQTQELSGKDAEQVTPTHLRNSIRNNYQIINTIQQRLQGHSVRQDDTLRNPEQQELQSQHYIQQNYNNTVYDAVEPCEVVDNTIRDTSYTNLNIDNSINVQDKPDVASSQYVKSMIYTKLDGQRERDMHSNNSEEISEIIKPIETTGIYSILFTPELDLTDGDEIKVTDILKREVGCLNAVPTAFIKIEEQTQSDLKIQHAFSVGIKQTPSVMMLQAKLLLVGFYNYGIRFIHQHKDKFSKFSTIQDGDRVYKQLVLIWSIYELIMETSDTMLQHNFNIYLCSIQRIAIDCQNDDLDNLQYILVFNSIYLLLKDHYLKIQQDILQTMGRITLQILEFQYQQPQLQYLGLISCGIYLMVQMTDKIVNSQLQTQMCNTAGYLIQQYKELKYFKGYKQLFETQGIQ